MKILIYWRRDRIIAPTRFHEVWQFWSDGFKFSCSLSSIHKRRRPERVFLGFAHHRPLNNYEYKEMGKFVAEEREIYNKIK